MGKSYIENSLKRFLKRKVKITMGVVVAFLITGMVSFGANDYPLMSDKIGNSGYINAMESLNGLGTVDISVDKNYSTNGNSNSLKIEKEGKVYKFILGSTTLAGEIKINEDLISKKTAEIIKKATEVTEYQEFNSDFNQKENNGFIKFSNTEAQVGNQIINNGIISGYRGQKGTGENAKVINNGILLGSTDVQKLEGTGIIINNGFIFAGNGNAQSGGTTGIVENYGVILATTTGQTGKSTYNYGVISGPTGQGISGGIGENYGIIISSLVGQQSNSGTSEVYNYGTINSFGKGMLHTANSSLYNYGLIKVTNDYGMTNHATSSAGETINKGVIHSSDKSLIFEDGKKKIENTGIVITDNQDVYSKAWAKTGVTLNGKYELQNKDTGVAITGNLTNSSFENKNIGYIHTNDKTSLGISNITADRNEEGDIVNRKVLGVVAEQNSTVFTAKENLLLDGIDMTGYLINGGTFIDMKGNSLILSDVNITVTEDLTKTNGEKAVAVDLGTGKLSLIGTNTINGIIKGGEGSNLEALAQKTEIETNTDGTLIFKNAESDKIKDINYTDIKLTGVKADKIETIFTHTSGGKENTVEIGENFVLGTAQDYKTETVIQETSTAGNKSNYIINNLDKVHGNISLGAGENTVTVNKFDKYDGTIDLGAGEDKFIAHGEENGNYVFNYHVKNAETIELNGGTWGDWGNAQGTIGFTGTTQPNLVLGGKTTMNITLNAEGNHGSDFANYVGTKLGLDHATITGTGNVKYLIDEKGLDSEKLTTDKYSFGKDINYKSAIFNIESDSANKKTTVTIKTANEMGLSGQDRIIYDAYIDQIKVGTANKDVIGQINAYNTSEDFAAHIKQTSVTGEAYYTAGSVVTKDIVNSYVSSVEDFTKRAGKGEWLAQGKYINSDTEFDGGSRVKGYDGDITGTVGMIEYGVTEDTSYGVAYGQGGSEMDINGGGKLDGDNTYFGAYMKHRTQNGIELVANLGYVENDMDSVLRNDFKVDEVNMNSKTFEKGTADSSAVVLSLKGRKDYKVTDTVKLQPVLGARVTFINQDKAENPEMNFTIAEQDIIVVEGTAGMGVAKEFALSQGKLELNAGAEYTFAAANSNNDAEYTLFEGDYQATHIKMDDVDAAENTGTVYAGFDYEHESGVGFNGKYEMMWSDKGDDSRITAGISYRF